MTWRFWGQKKDSGTNRWNDFSSQLTEALEETLYTSHRPESNRLSWQTILLKFTALMSKLTHAKRKNVNARTLEQGYLCFLPRCTVFKISCILFQVCAWIFVLCSCFRLWIHSHWPLKTSLIFCSKSVL